MEQYKQEFIEFMIDCNVLKFGDFVTKSGRKTEFFFQIWRFRNQIWKKNSVFCKHRILSYRSSVKKIRTVLCKSN